MQHPREGFYRIHLYLVTQVLMMLNHATSYKIKDCTDELAKKYVGLTHRKRDLHKCQMSLRTIQNILVELKKKGKVNHDDNTKRPVYYLTEAGYRQKLFGVPFGKALLNNFIEIPLENTIDKKILECVNRMGLYITYIFMRNLEFNWGSSTQPIIAKYDSEWTDEAINSKLLFKWFANQITFEKVPRTLRYRYDNEIMRQLRHHFPKLVQNLEMSEMAFNRKFFKDEFTANKKWLDSLESKQK